MLLQMYGTDLLQEIKEKSFKISLIQGTILSPNKLYLSEKIAFTWKGWLTNGGNDMKAENICCISIKMNHLIIIPDW